MARPQSVLCLEVSLYIYTGYSVASAFVSSNHQKMWLSSGNMVPYKCLNKAMVRKFIVSQAGEGGGAHQL